MNWHHFSAFLWLHWRLRLNQIKRGGLLNQIVLAIVAVQLALLAVALFFGSFALAFLVHDVSPLIHLLIWDGAVLCFLCWWCVGLIVDLQRAEALSLTKFLHLPVSLSGVFVLNYLSSLLSLNLMIFVPTMVGFSLGLTFASGPLMLLLLPLITSFFLMVTALSYQFQGWLASLMVDKRRRRTIIFLVTLVFVLIFQLPNLINFIRPWETEKGELPKALRSKEKRQELKEQAEEIGWYANAALPPGWLPLGAMGLSDGSPLAAILGTAGMSLIGGASLWRAYRTTLRLYTGEFTRGTPAAAPVPEPTRESERPENQPAGFLARKLPWLSEPASAVALASLRSLSRAPEARMLLLSPLFMLVIFGGLTWRGSLDVPELARPLLAFGAVAFIFMTLIQLVGNQFGFDRSGFRVYVLSPAPRSDILLGKNLGVFPLALLLFLPLIILLQVVRPMRIDHFLALAPQFVSMYLLFCTLANFLSIYAPMPIAAGSMKATKVEFSSVLLHMLFVFVFGFVQALSLLPLGIESLLEYLQVRYDIPVCLILTTGAAFVVVWLYRRVVCWQGQLLQAREQRILEVVTAKSE